MTEPDASLRVSDAERDQTLRVLGEHAAVGRLTLDELEERSGRALAAKTRGELATLTGDLPQEAGQDRPAPTLAKKPVRWMVAIMSGSQRRGRFRAVGSINSIAIMGGDEIDLREAEIEGGATLYIPDTVELDVGGFSLLGGNTEIGSERPPRPGAPVIRLRAWNLLGGPTIYRVPPQAQGRGPGRAAPARLAVLLQHVPQVAALALVYVRRFDDHQQPPGRPGE